jgi:AcrR family transcriptional regulator
MQKKPDLQRRTRIRPRAQRTIDDLFEATAQLLEAGLPERLTTNHVAARAGYSIGTVYRYFPDKLALLRAMASREIQAQEAKVIAGLDGLKSAVCTEPVVRIFVRAALHPFAGRHRVHSGVRQLLATAPDPQHADEALRAVSSSLLLPDMSDDTKFTMIHAVTGAIEAALHSKPELISSRDFEDQLVGLVLHFVHAGKHGAQSPM